jgi:hypothetical protein
MCFVWPTLEAPAPPAVPAAVFMAPFLAAAAAVLPSKSSKVVEAGRPINLQMWLQQLGALVFATTRSVPEI